jgi:hypothetical protein
MTISIQAIDIAKNAFPLHSADSSDPTFPSGVFIEPPQNPRADNWLDPMLKAVYPRG